LNLPDQPDETKLEELTLPAFLLTVYGKQGNGEAGEDKKLEMEVMKDIGIQRLVACSWHSYFIPNSDTMQSAVSCLVHAYMQHRMCQ